MDSFLEIATRIFLCISERLSIGSPITRDPFEEWLFQNIPAREYYRGLNPVPFPPPGGFLFDRVIRQIPRGNPDIVVAKQDQLLGIECKSLEIDDRFLETRRGNPCRTTLDFNSRVPCGMETYRGKVKAYKSRMIRTFYALDLYRKVNDHFAIHSFLLVDGNYLNRDVELHQTHRNISRSGFGSYEDGKIRERKMYLFPNPLTDPGLIASVSLIAECEDLEKSFPEVVRVLERPKVDSQGAQYSFFVYQRRR